MVNGESNHMNTVEVRGRTLGISVVYVNSKTLVAFNNIVRVLGVFSYSVLRQCLWKDDQSVSCRIANLH